MTESTVLKVGKFTFTVAPDRCYTFQGVWAMADVKIVRIGLSDYLQQRSGDIAFAEVKPVGTILRVGDEAAAIETIKVTLELPSPAAGTILRVNPLMETAPETINLDPYGEGWLCEIEAVDWEGEREKLLDPEAYFAQMQREAENEVKKND